MPAPANPRYTRLHHAYWLTPGLDGLPARAETTWTRALAHADQNLTDGRLTRTALKMIDRTPRDAAALVAAGLWTPTAEGWQINDYDQWATPAATISKQRKDNAARQARHRERNALRGPEEPPDTDQFPLDLRPHADESSANVSHDCQTETGDYAGQATATPESNALRNASKPDQTRPYIGDVGVYRSGVSQHTARTNGAGAPGMDRNPSAPARCNRHAHLPDDDPGPPCHACKAAREARQTAEHDQTQRDAEHRKQRQLEKRERLQQQDREAQTAAHTRPPLTELFDQARKKGTAA